MRIRAQALVQVCVALACALGAGFSGDMFARESSQTNHGNRHASRGSHPRGYRSLFRTGHGDLYVELELLHYHEDDNGGYSIPGSHPAILQDAPVSLAAFLELAITRPYVAPPGHSLQYSLASPRAPPILL